MYYLNNKLKALLFVIFFVFNLNLSAQDPNFYIFLCFGQSNMEGQGNIEELDKTVSSRFKVLQALDCPNIDRVKGKWYPAVPPSCQCFSKLSPADYFGRTLLETLPGNITVGIINVAVGGCDIRLFDRDIYQDYDSTYKENWFTSKVANYGGNPYNHLIELAKLAQKDGVIKGILLHQGETNTGQTQWPLYVKKIYHDMLTDLNLNAQSVPIIAGEVVSAEGSCCSSMNVIINQLPNFIPTAHVVSSAGCPAQDNAHFNAEGYRILGKRYGNKMLEIMGYSQTKPTQTKLSSKITNKKSWVGTWSTAPQLVEPHNMPPAPGLDNNTLRQIIKVSVGGKYLQFKFSNEFSNSPVTLNEVQVAISKGGGTIDASSIKSLKFNANPNVIINPGEVLFSDPVEFNLSPRMELAITIYFGQTSPDVTGHPGSRTTSYLFKGNQISVADTAGCIRTDHWYVINGVDVLASKKSAAIAIIGNSITDGRGSGTNKQNRWPDILSEKLLKNKKTNQVGVLNMGIGGNCVLKNCLGQAAIKRFERDILKQNGVRWLIVLEGINDIGQAPKSPDADKIAKGLIDAYSKMIEIAHSKGIKAYGATILPFGKSFYYDEHREAARKTVNDWIRSSGKFDAVIDFDKIMQNPEDVLTIKPEYHTGDFLHPNELGYKKMGESIDLKLFE